MVIKLGRLKIDRRVQDFIKLFENRKILVTGGTGSIGNAIVENALKYNPQTIRVLSNDEDSLFQMSQRLNDKRVRFFVGDVKDKKRLQRAVEGIDFVFHAAALKHVPLCEYNPTEAVATNVIGTQNVVEAAMEEEVEAVLTISTDKAAGPTNVLGASKLLSEKLTVSANYNKGYRKTRFFCVRFGNVLGSRGSVVPTFKSRIEDHKTIQITDPRMTRFIMNYAQAIHLLFKCLKIAKGSEIFVLKMPVVNIKDLALTVSVLFGKGRKVDLEVVGRRPGEKLHEELLSEHELDNSLHNEEMYIILPDISRFEYRYKGFRKVSTTKAYRSDSVAPLPLDKIRELIASQLK